MESQAERAAGPVDPDDRLRGGSRRRPTRVVRLRVNGEDHELEVRSDETLLETLRQQLQQFGPREGCGIGICGACTVLVDGQPATGCLLLTWLVVERHVLTVEGLAATDGRLDPIQEVFLEYNAFQCSYCTPGFLLTARALLDEEPDQSAGTVREALAGNLCRCGSYLKIEAAVIEAGRRQRGLEARSPGVSSVIRSVAGHASRSD
jgi:aerobic-type carbon monoxide dehydrogenase small subunit (CoxS/CutS family)